MEKAEYFIKWWYLESKKWDSRRTGTSSKKICPTCMTFVFPEVFLLFDCSNYSTVPLIRLFRPVPRLLHSDFILPCHFMDFLLVGLFRFFNCPTVSTVPLLQWFHFDCFRCSTAPYERLYHFINFSPFRQFRFFDCSCTFSTVSLSHHISLRQFIPYIFVWRNLSPVFSSLTFCPQELIP